MQEFEASDGVQRDTHHALLIALMMPMRANNGGPCCSATSNKACIAACHSSASCSALGQFGDVRGGVTERDQRFSGQAPRSDRQTAYPKTRICICP
jgi:hypothetical protein